MNVDLGTAIAVGSIIFAAGQGWMILRRTEKRGADQGRRIGKLEIGLAELRAEVRTALRGRRLTLPEGYAAPPPPPED